MKTIRSLLLFGALVATALAVSNPSLHAADESPPVVAAAVAAETISATPLAITAEDSTPDVVLSDDAGTGVTWQQSLIVVITPLLIAGLKKLVPQIPKLWLPILAAVLGGLGAWVNSIATGADLNVWLGLGLGLAGVGLREATKQISAAASPAGAS